MRYNPTLIKNENSRFTIFIIIFYLFVSLGVSIVHLYKVDLPHHNHILELHQKVINNFGPAPIQYRILSYYLAEFLRKVGVAFDYTYFIIRFAFTFLAILALHFFWIKWLKPTLCSIGVLFLLAIMSFTYMNYYHQPTDPLNLLFFIISFWLIRERKDYLLVPILFISIFNRETTILIPLVYFFYRYDELPLKKLFLRFGFISLSVLIPYIGLKFIYGVKQYYCEAVMFYINFHDWRSFYYPLILYSIFWFFAFVKIKQKPKFIKRSLLILPFFLLVHYWIAIAIEVRLFLPLAPLIIASALLNFETIEKEKFIPHLSNFIVKFFKPIYLMIFLFFLLINRELVKKTEAYQLKDVRNMNKFQEFLNKAKYFLQNNQKEDAEKNLAWAEHYGENLSDAQYELGVFYAFYLKKFSKAKLHWQKCLQLNPYHHNKDFIIKQMSSFM